MSKAEEIPALSFILEPLSECQLFENAGCSKRDKQEVQSGHVLMI